MIKLSDPTLPLGEIVEKRPDGIWVRNDGVELSPADDNPYYQLATIADRVNATSTMKSLAPMADRRIWNALVLEDIGAQHARKLAAEMGVDASELRSFSPQLKHAVGLAMATHGIDGLPDLKQLSFSRLYFTGGVDFNRFIFPPVSFSKCYFERQTFFHGAYFSSNADFSECHFNYMAAFTNARFSSMALFTSTHFGERAAFKGAVFSDMAWFEHARFQEAAMFSDGAFNGPVSFEGARFKAYVPDFFQRNFHDNTTFSPATEHWPKVERDKAHLHKNAYRRLRQVSAEQQNTENEHFFLRREMACDAVLKKDWLSRWIVRGFGWISDYGYSVWRPIAGLLTTWIIGALLVQTVFAWAFVYAAPPEGMTTAPGLPDAFGLGLANTFAIFGFRSYYLGEAYMVSLPVFVKLIGGLQTVLGFVFLFFLGLGLRNRFRLK